MAKPTKHAWGVFEQRFKNHRGHRVPGFWVLYSSHKTEIAAKVRAKHIGGKHRRLTAEERR